MNFPALDHPIGENSFGALTVRSYLNAVVARIAAEAQPTEVEAYMALLADDYALTRALMAGGFIPERNMDQDVLHLGLEKEVFYVRQLCGRRRDYDGEMILNLPMGANDTDASNVREYLASLVRRLWIEGESFSANRPFGNSGWDADLFHPLVTHGIIKGTFDVDGRVEEYDSERGERAILDAIEALGKKVVSA